tara:strand:+ start:1641 stop:2855 length:1215 start_codon:yes stop_codon:yes gene_type:complete
MTIQPFKSFLTEAKNVHMEHLEDAILNDGTAGGEQAIEFLSAVTDMLSGNNQSRVDLTVKWDGAPAIFAGINPDNGKFFVGSKSVFNKRTPKINYTNADIDKNHPGGLGERLKIALKHLPKLGIKGILQGDMMFIKSDLKQETIDGQEHVTFQPNTIAYAVPVDSTLSKEIKSSKMGIVFHTAYKGRTFSKLKASFNPRLTALRKTRDVWFRDAAFKDVSGTATFTKAETTKIKKQITKLKTSLSSVSSFLDKFISNTRIIDELKIYSNSMVKQGAAIGSAEDFTTFVKDKMQAAIDNLKTDSAKKRKSTELEDLISELKSNQSKIDKIFSLYRDLSVVKVDIIKKLETIKDIGTFVPTSDGYKSTAPEGFVAIDRYKKGSTLKLVDRMQFSRQNFNAPKNWTP